MTMTALHPAATSEGGARRACQALVLYDGLCPLCQRSVRLLRQLDWFARLHFQDARSAEPLPATEPALVFGRLLEEMHLVTPDGSRVYHGFAAFRWMAWRLPALWLLAPFLYLPGVPRLGQKVYLWVARNRFRLVPCHGGVCELPKPETFTAARQAPPATVSTKP